MQPEELREVLIRAEQIQSQQVVNVDQEVETETIVQAAEEAGLSRDAVLQALQERLALTQASTQPGAIVMAESADGHFYAARVISSDTVAAKVKFLSGGEQSLPLNKIKPFSPVPGTQFSCPWQNWGWWNCKVVSYDSDNMRLLVTDGWGNQQGFHISEVRQNKERSPQSNQSLYYLYLGLTGFGGMVLGFVIRWLMFR
ncbi:MAG: hypothetical protein JST40_09665 [Armatimonadetes bacterium]|nr:hypothetical protein [Armatimonadota bacterium]